MTTEKFIRIFRIVPEANSCLSNIHNIYVRQEVLAKRNPQYQFPKYPVLAINNCPDYFKNDKATWVGFVRMYFKDIRERIKEYIEIMKKISKKELVQLELKL